MNAASLLRLAFAASSLRPGTQGSARAGTRPPTTSARSRCRRLLRLVQSSLVSQAKLFVDEPEGVSEPGHGVVAHARAGRPLGTKQRAFNRLLARVERLRAQRDTRKRHLEDALVFHAAEIAPRARHALQLRTELVGLLRVFLHDRRLSAGDRRILADVVARQVDWILAHDDAPDPDVRELFEELHGVSLADVEQEQIDRLNEEMKDFLAGEGLDVDIPDVRAGMTPEELAASAAGFIEQMQSRLDEATAREQASGHRKTKREMREEERARRIEEARRSSIGAIYRRLAKALHPDLERDPAQRERKSELMQQVTAAHRANDLHTLLRLEVELVHGEASDVATLTTETLDAYTEMLKQQAAELQAEEMELLFNPKYQPVVVLGPFGPIGVIDGEAEMNRLEMEIEELRGSLELLSTPRAVQEVKALVRMERGVRRAPAPARRRR